MSRLGKNTCRLFSDNPKTDGKGWRDYMAERSRKREAQVRLLVASQEAIAQKNVSRILLPSLKTVANASGTTNRVDYCRRTFPTLRLSEHSSANLSVKKNRDRYLIWNSSGKVEVVLILLALARPYFAPVIP